MADALSIMNAEDTSETEKFIRLMDTFFDCLNVRSLNEGDRKRKPNLKPYREASDERFKVWHAQFLITTVHLT